MAFSVDELSGGSKSFKFDEIGDKCVGEIAGIERRQQTDFSDGHGLTWDDGSPRMQTVITVQTNADDGNDDDGVRTVWLKGGRNFEISEGSGQSGESALFDAAGGRGGVLEEGGQIAIQFTGRSKPTQRGYQPAKLYEIQYKAPVASIAADDLFDD